MNVGRESKKARFDEQNHDDKTRQAIIELSNRYVVTLQQLLQPSIPHCPTCSITTESRPVLSSITSLKESTVVRVAVGSHKQSWTDNKVLIHDAAVIDVHVPPTYSLLFFHHSTIHSGGPASTPSLRVFSTFGPVNEPKCNSNRNHLDVHKYCNNDCKQCRMLRVLKRQFSDNLFPCFDELIGKQSVGDLLGLYDLDKHGFCVIKVAESSVLSKSLVNLIEQKYEKCNGIKFRKLGQEEVSSKIMGNRCILDNEGSFLNTKMLLEQKCEDVMKDYFNECESNIAHYLSTKYGTYYEEKEKSLLMNIGKVGYQKLHTDGGQKCNCFVRTNK